MKIDKDRFIKHLGEKVKIDGIYCKSLCHFYKPWEMSCDLFRKELLHRKTESRGYRTQECLEIFKEGEEE